MIKIGSSRRAMLLSAGAIAVFCGVYRDVLLGTKIFTHDSIIWFGTYHQYVRSLLSGNFPYWDPYLQGGTYFYPNISLLGLLDPTVLASALIVKVFDLSLLTGYVYFYLSRLFLFAAGSYVLFRHITNCRMSAALSAGLLMLAMTPAYFRQPGAVDLIYLTPLALYYLLRLFEDPKSHRRYLYVAALTLITGISMNVFIPAYYLFNLVSFIVVLLSFKFLSIATVLGIFRERRFLLYSLLAVVLTAMMAMPPLMVMFRDAGAGGELFPMVRIVQKSDGNLKKIEASDIGTDSVSNKFTGQQGVFSSYGNFLNMVYPDIFESVPYFANDLLSEIPQYIGIIPFLLALIGLFYHSSRYRILAAIMMVIMTINMFSFAGMSGKPFNILQQAFNSIFPPLKMVEVREVFGSFFLLYFCISLSLGLSIFFDGDKLLDLLKIRYRQIAGICAGIVLVKIGVTAYYANRILAASPYDAFVLVQIACAAGGLWLYRNGALKKNSMQVALVLIIFADIAVYSVYNAHYVLTDSAPYHAIADADRNGESERSFQYFKMPFPATAGVAFGDSILRVKGVLTTGNNHSIFTTRRYYDLLTNIPPQNQLALAGVVFPVIRFFPDDASVRPANDRKWLLGHLAVTGEDDILQNVYIEQGGLVETPYAQMGDLRAYENVDAFQPQNLFRFLQLYDSQRGPFIEEMKKRRDRFLRTYEYTLMVRSFSQNEIMFDVKNLRGGYLLYNDGWSRYWKAYDGGREIPVLIANYNSKAVFLGPGEHQVRFVFDPVHYKIGLVLYYAGLLISLVLITVFFIVARRKKSAL